MHTFASCYTGAGGFDIGFIEAGFAPVWSNEINSDAVATYRTILRHYGFDQEHSTCGDIALVAPPESGSVDVLIGGPPCQGFSRAGRMDPDDERSSHVWRFLDMVKCTQPSVFVMENVAALATSKRWAGVRNSLISSAQQLGYTVSLLVLNAADFGVPQNRLRMFLVGSKSGRDADIKLTGESHVSVRSALGTIPAWGDPGNNTLCDAKITLAKQPVLRKSPWAGMLFNGAGRPMNLEVPSPTLPASMGGNRTPIVDQAWIDDPSCVSWVQKYHGALQSHGSAIRVVECALIPSSLRRITVEEAALLQSFPTWVDWQGSKSSRFRQIGNAVPPLLAKAIAEMVRGLL